MSIVCHNVRPAGTSSRTPGARHNGACWVQNQNQNQTVVTAVRGVCGSSFHPSHGELGQPRATHPTAVPGAWMELRKVGGGS